MQKFSPRSVWRRTSAITVSLVMLLSLALPLSSRAETPVLPEESTTQLTQTPATDASILILQDQSSNDSQTPSHEASEEIQTTKSEDSSPAIANNAPTTSTNSPTSPTPENINSSTEGSVQNTINSTANSGDANASSNSTVLDVTSGDASALAMVVTMLQSSVNLNGVQPIVFIQDVNGTVNGDIFIDPATLTSSLEPTAPTASTPLHIDASTQLAIDNIITLSATSGDASASKNSSAGNVQSGTANTIASVVNVINSAINANQSFIGMINIYGNLNGNIVLPAEFVDSILGTGDSTDGAQKTFITTDNNVSVVNNVNANAQSGNATSSGNSSSGNIATGDANTNITILNLTNSQVSSKNALLVFVNVMGKWVGLILDAPSGTTSASLSGGTATHNPEHGEYVIDATNNLQINNTINTNSSSGDATGANNTKVGNIQSGNANSGVNILNIMNSQISLSDWFGILFINVFGEWIGDFGTQPPITVQPPVDAPGEQPSTNDSTIPKATITFTDTSTKPSPSRGAFRALNSNYSTTNSATTSPQPSTDESTLGDNTKAINCSTVSLQSHDNKTAENQNFQNWLMLLAIQALLLILLYYLLHRRVGNTTNPYI